MGDYLSIEISRTESLPFDYDLVSSIVQEVEITNPFLALVDALDLDTPAGEQGWLAGRPSKQNIQPGALGIWMSDLCRRLMVEMGFDPRVLKRKGKVIGDLAIERG